MLISFFSFYFSISIWRWRRILISQCSKFAGVLCRVFFFLAWLFIPSELLSVLCLYALSFSFSRSLILSKFIFFPPFSFTLFPFASMLHCSLLSALAYLSSLVLVDVNVTVRLAASHVHRSNQTFITKEDATNSPPPLPPPPWKPPTRPPGNISCVFSIIRHANF